MKRQEIKHISYLDIQRGFSLTSHIRSINDNPTEIIITANKISSDFANNIFIIDAAFLNLEEIKNEFSAEIIKINEDIGNDYLRNYLIEII